jgi:hypothetical protein
MSKPNLIIRMGAAHWDVRVRAGSEFVHFNLRKMYSKQRSDFHRELMNAFRASIKGQN